MAFFFFWLQVQVFKNIKIDIALTKTVELKNLDAVKKNEETPLPFPEFVLNESVNVESRTLRGENKPGGVAQITNVEYHRNLGYHYDVKYTLDGRSELKVSESFLKKYNIHEGGRGKKRSSSSSSSSLSSAGCLVNSGIIFYLFYTKSMLLFFIARYLFFILSVYFLYLIQNSQFPMMLR